MQITTFFKDIAKTSSFPQTIDRPPSLFSDLIDLDQELFVVTHDMLGETNEYQIYHTSGLIQFNYALNISITKVEGR